MDPRRKPEMCEFKEFAKLAGKNLKLINLRRTAATH